MNKKRNKTLFRRAGKFFAFIIAIVCFLLVISAVVGTVSPSSISNLKQKLDAAWWLASIIRWITIVILLLWLPKFIKKREEKLFLQGQNLFKDYERAEDNNASYETLLEYETALFDIDKMVDVYRLLQRQFKYVILFFIAIEVLAVQLPHLL